VAAAQVVPPATDGVVGIGSFVLVRYLAVGEVVEYELVGTIESDVANGRVSVDAPVGQALVGRRAGEIVQAETPRGMLQFEIVSARPIVSRPAARAA
jgi:transcription elongation factor GreA